MDKFSIAFTTQIAWRQDSSARFAIARFDDLIFVRGDLDYSTVPILERAITVTPRIDSGHLILDLADMTFIDGSGLNLLIRLRNHLKQDGCRLVLQFVPDSALRLIELFQLRDSFKIS